MKSRKQYASNEFIKNELDYIFSSALEEMLEKKMT